MLAETSGYFDLHLRLCSSNALVSYVKPCQPISTNADTMPKKNKKKKAVEDIYQKKV